MELGQRLKQARLECGMSQRQLCGDVITRNMLSQIENGAANPSMETLRYLASQLKKPMGYFLEEQVITSPNQAIMTQARSLYPQDPQQVLNLLTDYRPQDEIFDQEYHLLSALCRIKLAEKALSQEKNEYAWRLLEETAQHGSQTIYYTPQLERKRLLLCYQARPDQAQSLAVMLPDNLKEILLRAAAETDPVKQGRILDSCVYADPQWQLLRAKAYFAQKDYRSALSHFENAPHSPEIYQQMELCCKELEDYKSAYFYAVKAREFKV